MKTGVIAQPSVDLLIKMTMRMTVTLVVMALALWPLWFMIPILIPVYVIYGLCVKMRVGHCAVCYTRVEFVSEKKKCRKCGIKYFLDEDHVMRTIG